MNKCFLLNPEKNLVQIRLVVFEKNAKIANSDALSNSEKFQAFGNQVSESLILALFITNCYNLH